MSKKYFIFTGKKKEQFMRKWLDYNCGIKGNYYNQHDVDMALQFFSEEIINQSVREGYGFIIDLERDIDEQVRALAGKITKLEIIQAMAEIIARQAIDIQCLNQHIQS